jgi:A/G-specific adenine glycosylase
MARARAPERFADCVIRWQRRHGRHGLPWQGTRDPYRVWLAETMLQQTQVRTAERYYERFLQAFPDLESLARAPQDDVLARWSGLGYYSRARNLHRAARLIVADGRGVFPRKSSEIGALPGIGRSTAAAIAAFCFGERAAILDGNVKRVLARVLGFAKDLAQPANERWLWQQAQALLPERDVEVYTQGLMDLGAMVCTRRSPACGRCPLAGGCAARRAGEPELFPVRSRRSARGRRTNALLWLQHRGRLWLGRRPQRGVWAGLWSFPEFATLSQATARAEGWPGRGERLPPIEHALTHFDWTLEPLRWRLPARTAAAALAEIEAALGEGRWFGLEEALAAALPAPVRRLLTDR